MSRLRVSSCDQLLRRYFRHRVEHPSYFLVVDSKAVTPPTMHVRPQCDELQRSLHSPALNVMTRPLEATESDHGPRRHSRRPDAVPGAWNVVNQSFISTLVDGDDRGSFVVRVDSPDFESALGASAPVIREVSTECDSKWRRTALSLIESSDV